MKQFNPCFGSAYTTMVYAGFKPNKCFVGCEMRRKILNRFVAVTMTLCMGIGVCGCSGSKETQDNNYDIKHEIGRAHV